METIKRLACFRDKVFTTIEDFNHAECDEYERKLDYIHKFEKLSLNLESLKDTYDKIIAALEQKNENGYILLSSILLYLAQFQAFLFHWEKLLKNTHGSDSIPVNKFKRSTSEEYDGHFAYRFLYELRNYMHH